MKTIVVTRTEVEGKKKYLPIKVLCDPIYSDLKIGDVILVRNARSQSTTYYKVSSGEIKTKRRKGAKEIDVYCRIVVRKLFKTEQLKISELRYVYDEQG